MKLIDLTGQVYGKLTVIGRGPIKKQGATIWACRCECGTVRNVQAGNLKSGDVISCGCTKRKNGNFGASDYHISNIPVNPETLKSQDKPGGLVWIKDRCKCSHERMSHTYFLGICERCKYCANFVSVVGLVNYKNVIKRPGVVLPTTGIKTPLKANKVKAATGIVNKVGTRRGEYSQKLITYNGKTQNLTAWANDLGLRVGTVQMRIKRGWPLERVLSVAE